jgi:RNA-splicing ligase RtcB
MTTGLTAAGIDHRATVQPIEQLLRMIPDRVGSNGNLKGLMKSGDLEEICTKGAGWAVEPGLDWELGRILVINRYWPYRKAQRALLLHLA